MTTAVIENGITVKSSKAQSRSWLSRHLLTIILVVILIIGIMLLLYPTFASWWNSTRQSRAVDQYIAELEEIDQAQIEKALADAKEYNWQMAQTGMGGQLSAERQKDYESQLSYAENGIMGYVEINSLDIRLPIYHGTDDAILTQGIGHLEWTSLPVGTKTWDDDKGIVTDPDDGVHCVISGHRGLPSTRLFTDLDKMTEGDTFALNIYNNLVIYEVDQIRVVLPEDLSELQLEKGHDYCTLVTCTPYGINTHRLLVRGHRVSTKDADRYIYRIQGNATQIKPAAVAAVIAAPILLILFLIVMIDPFKRRKNDKGI